jgi:hypothetical protein
MTGDSCCLFGCVLDGLLVVLRGINQNAGTNHEDMVSLRIWVERDHMISVRQRKVIAPRAVLAELDQSMRAVSRTSR